MCIRRGFGGENGYGSDLGGGVGCDRVRCIIYIDYEWLNKYCLFEGGGCL